MTKPIFFLLFAFYFLFTIACNSKIEADVANPSEIAPPTEAIKQADALFAQRKDVAKLREALNIIARARNPNQRNFEVEWKFAKYNYFLSKQITDEKEADKNNKDGYAAALIASRIEPTKADGYFWAGANLGEQSRRNPLTVGIKSMGEIRELMNKVIEIQPNYQGASAYDALAQLEMASRLTSGKPEKAVEFLEKALAIEKANSFLHLHLAEAYLAVKKDAEAKKQLDLIFKMKLNPEYEVETIEVENEAKRLLASRF